MDKIELKVLELIHEHKQHPKGSVVSCVTNDKVKYRCSCNAGGKLSRVEDLTINEVHKLIKPFDKKIIVEFGNFK